MHAHHRPALAFASAAILTAGLLAGCTTVQPDPTEDGPGVTDDTITLGALSALTGTFAAGATRQLAGAELYWDQVNGKGGVCDGRTVKILARDNGYDPQKTVTAYSDISSQILAVQLLTGTPMTQAVAPQMEADSVSAIPMSWSPALLGEKSILIPGTTYDLDMVNAVDYLLDEGTLKEGDRIAYIYFGGDFGEAGLAGATFAAEQHGISVDPFQVDPTVSDLTAQITQIQSSGDAAIFMSANPPLLANAAAVSDTQGLDIPIIVPTPTFVPELLSSPAADQIAERVIVVSPYNAWAADDDAIKFLRDEFDKSGDDGTPQQFFIAGYAAASLMHSAIEAACKAGPLTRETLKEQFASATTFAMKGLSVDLDFSDRSVPAATGDYLHHVDKDADGGLTPLVTEPYTGDDVDAFLQSK
jgi:ABC-type branched-subunit amino acid transport system substrate-binding protein